jgi:hypothetical protein
MRSKLSVFVPSPAMGVTLAALLAASAGLAVAATSSQHVIRACANKRSGLLRLSTKCRRNERGVSWSRTGPQGPPGVGVQGPPGVGVQGARGLTGAAGATGPQGPGATSFVTTLAEGAADKPIATLANGVTVIGQCGSSVGLVLSTAGPGLHFQASGTVTQESEVHPYDTFEGSSGRIVNALNNVDVALLARDSSVGPFARVEAHGTHGSPCIFWGMIIPST